MIKTTNLKDSYTFYRNHYKTGIPNCDYRTGLPIYMLIVGGLMKFMFKKVFAGFDIRLGAGLGVLGIRGKKIEIFIDKDGNVKGVAPNWGETKKLQARDPIAKENRTIVYCTNEHSNGIRYSFFWSKEGVIIENKSLYHMSISKGNRTELTRLIFEEQREYIVNI